MKLRTQLRIEERMRQRLGALSPRMWFPGMVCVICGERIRQWQMFNHDHVIPKSQGGACGRRNKAFAHVICNSVKNDQHPFSLRTAEEREAIFHRVRRATYDQLTAAWRGE